MTSNSSATITSSSELDEHVSDQIEAIEESLTRVDEVFGTLGSIDYNEVTKNMGSLDKAKYDLTNLYAINSLFWMYLRSFGEDPKTTAMKDELDRIRQQMLRLSQIANKSKAGMPRIDKNVAGRFIKHQIGNNNTSNQKPSNSNVHEEDWDEPMETDNQKRGRKRKREESELDEEADHLDDQQDNHLSDTVSSSDTESDGSKCD